MDNIVFTCKCCIYNQYILLIFSLKESADSLQSGSSADEHIGVPDTSEQNNQAGSDAAGIGKSLVPSLSL
jgi:hypothetical protein